MQRRTKKKKQQKNLGTFLRCIPTMRGKDQQSLVIM